MQNLSSMYEWMCIYGYHLKEREVGIGGKKEFFVRPFENVYFHDGSRFMSRST